MIDANNISGRRTSRANCNEPSTLAGMSRRGLFVPTILYSEGSFKGGVCEGVISATNEAKAAYGSLRLVPKCIRWLFSVTTSFSGTAQEFAAASRNISRVAAPAIRIAKAPVVRTLMLPPVSCILSESATRIIAPSTVGIKIFGKSIPARR